MRLPIVAILFGLAATALCQVQFDDGVRDMFPEHDNEGHTQGDWNLENRMDDKLGVPTNDEFGEGVAATRVVPNDLFVVPSKVHTAVVNPDSRMVGVRPTIVHPATTGCGCGKRGPLFHHRRHHHHIIPHCGHCDCSRAWKLGYQKGLDQGAADGKAKGIEDGTKSGEEQGYKDGMKVGEAEGFHQGALIGFGKGVVHGKKSGFEKGLVLGEKEGNRLAVKKGLDSGKSEGEAEGYEQGYAIGLEKGQKWCAEQVEELKRKIKAHKCALNKLHHFHNGELHHDDHPHHQDILPHAHKLLSSNEPVHIHPEDPLHPHAHKILPEFQ